MGERSDPRHTRTRRQSAIARPPSGRPRLPLTICHVQRNSVGAIYDTVAPGGIAGAWSKLMWEGVQRKALRADRGLSHEPAATRIGAPPLQALLPTQSSGRYARAEGTLMWEGVQRKALRADRGLSPEPTATRIGAPALQALLPTKSFVRRGGGSVIDEELADPAGAVAALHREIAFLLLAEVDHGVAA